MKEIELASGQTMPEDLLSQLREKCGELSAFQLFQLRHEIDQMLSDPDRINSARRQVRPGEVVEYFHPEENRCIAALVESCHRTRVSVRHLDDGEAWRIEYVSINVDDEPTPRPMGSGAKLCREQIAVGDMVGFTDKQHCERIGKVIKRNPKTAGILCEDGTRWRVSYSYLFSILDADSTVKTQHQPSLTFDDLPE